MKRWRAVAGAVGVSFGVLAGGCDTEEPLEPEECTERGGHIIGDPGDGSTDEDDCPEGERYLGRVRFGIEGGICCKP